jgi:hypothetical protein
MEITTFSTKSGLYYMKISFAVHWHLHKNGYPLPDAILFLLIAPSR